MIEPYRRGVLAGWLALVGSAIGAVGADEGADADSSGTDADIEEAADDERTDEAGDETGGDETDAAAPALELSVSLPKSIPAPKGRAEFLIAVLNCGEEARSASIALEVGCVEDELETPTLAPGESADAYASYAGRRLGRGTHEWSVAVGRRVSAGRYR